METGTESEPEAAHGQAGASPPSPVPTPRVGVVLPAGGSGTRLGGAPKQFRLLAGVPVLVQTLRAFERHPGVGPLVVAVPEASVSATRTMLSDAGVEATVVAGGATRAASVWNGIQALPADVEAVLVHDAVRPFVMEDLITRVVAAVQQFGAAAAAIPVADTLRRARSGQFGATVDRSTLWAMQTPQGATRDLFARAYAIAGDEAPTDEAGLLGLAGVAVHVVEGDARNVKVTTPSDWALAEALWPTWSERFW